MEEADRSIRHFGDIRLRLSAELPCRALSVREILALEPGAVLVTPRAAGDNVDVHVEQRHFADAEIVVLGNSLGVRLSDFSESP